MSEQQYLSVVQNMRLPVRPACLSHPALRSTLLLSQLDELGLVKNPGVIAEIFIADLASDSWHSQYQCLSCIKSS